MLSRTSVLLASGSSRAPVAFRSFSSPTFVARAKAAKPTPGQRKTTPKGGGFKVKKEEYAGNKKTVSSSKPGVLSAAQLSGHPLLQSPPRELDLPKLTPSIFTQAAIGSPITLPSGSGTIAGTFGLPLSIENEFSLLSSPTSIIRDTTLSVIEVLDNGAKSGTSSKDVRVVLTGTSGSGKSHLLLQAANYAAANKWVVLYVPRAISWVDSTTPYAYDARTQTFQQPALALEILTQFAEVNSGILRNPDTQITKDIENERLGTFVKGTPLSKLLDVGLRDQSLATEVLETALRVLGEQNKHPVLLAVDDFQALFCMSKYRNPQYDLVSAHHLTLVRIILEYASGKRTLTRGAVVGATSGTNPRFLEPLPLKEALGIIEPGTVSPYEQRSKSVLDYASGMKGLLVPPKMRVDEAASLFDIWVQNNALHTPPSDSFFLSKYLEASGNPREFVKTGLLTTLRTS